MNDSTRIRLFVVTGLSGSGKSTVAKCFEDLGYYCIDNLPAPLFRHLSGDPAGQVPGEDRVVLVTDLRAPGLAEELPSILEDIDPEHVEAQLIFIDASDDALVRRFSETRRPHPLDSGGRVIDSIRRERALLSELRGRADLVLDTTDWTIHELRAAIYREFSPENLSTEGLTVTLVSFGFKFGIPNSTDLMFDVRFLPNPYFVPELRERRGDEQPVQDFLDSTEEFGQVVDRFDDLLQFLLPEFRKENRAYLTVAVGCTGGRHRSVATCERLADRLSRAGWKIRVQHRDAAR